MPIRRLLPVLLLVCLSSFQADSLFFSSKKRDCIIKPWTEWGLCQSTPKGFIQLRSRNTVPPRNGGKPCPRNVFEEKSCTSASATTSLIRAAIGSLATVKSSSAKRPPVARWAEWKPVSKVNGARNRNRTSTNANGDTCQVLKDLPSGKIHAAGNCRSTRTSRSIKETLTSYFSRVRRQVLEPNRDVLFLIDRSGSIGHQNVQKMRDMTAGLINLFCSTVNLDYTRVSVATFNEKYEPLIRFDKYLKETQKKDLMDEIRALTFTSSGYTHLGEALRTARTQTLFDATWGARPIGNDVKKMIFLISDGCSNGPVTTASEAPLLQAADIDVWVVQVGSNEHCKEKMMNLDGGDSNCFTLFFYDNWDLFSDAATEFSSYLTCGLQTWSDLINQPCV